MTNLLATGEPPHPSVGFKWGVLIEGLCGILIIFFLFYFNRLVATLLSFAIRLFTWHQYRAYIRIQSIQLSLLSGRIFFKGLNYYGHNQAITIKSGYITWNYWSLKVRSASVLESLNSLPFTTKSSSSNIPLPSNPSDDPESNIQVKSPQTPKHLCPIAVQVTGLEVFFFNRTPAYDTLIESFNRQGYNLKDILVRNGFYSSLPNSLLTEKLTKNINDTKARLSSRNAGLPALLGLYPIYINCTKGAIVIGNENTPELLSTIFDRATGIADIGSSKPPDIYRQIYNFDVIHAVTRLRPNPDFQESQLSMGSHFSRATKKPRKLPPWLRSIFKKKIFQHKKVHTILDFFIPFFNDSNESIAKAPAKASKTTFSSIPTPDHLRWEGLSRYANELVANEHNEWEFVEYASIFTIFDSPKLTFVLFWDVPGLVPDTDLTSNINGQTETSFGDVNGSAPPAYGVDIFLYGATIHYGAWTNRCRVNLQNFFFPPYYIDSEYLVLSPGDSRVNSVFTMNIIFEDTAILRIPIREPSKDPEWKGRNRVSTTTGSRTKNSKSKPGRKLKNTTESDILTSTMRSYGWIDIRIPPSASVYLNMNLYTLETGFTYNLIVNSPSCEAYSSVNNNLLWRTLKSSFGACLSIPRKWDAMRLWELTIKTEDLDIFLLRDHIYFISDLLTDWSMRESADYYTFIPYRYLMDFELVRFKIFFNTNDSNVINDPANLDENSYLAVSGSCLNVNFTIPLENFKPTWNEISFKAHGPDIKVDLYAPAHSTLKTYLPSSLIAELDILKIEGTFTYAYTVSPSNLNRLNINIYGKNGYAYFYGIVLRQLLRFQENYFGEFYHFQTAEEYHFREPPKTFEALLSVSTEPPKSNELDFLLTIRADHVRAVLPANIFNASNNISASISYVNLDMRFNAYYMDVQADISPINFAVGKLVELNGTKLNSLSPTELFIDYTNVHWHRLLGLPLDEPAYACTWAINLGDISGELSQVFVQRFTSALQNIAFSFQDKENGTVPLEYSAAYYCTFLTAHLGKIKVMLLQDLFAMLAECDPICIKFSDLCDKNFSDRLEALLPSIKFTCIELARKHSKADEFIVAKTLMYAQTSVHYNLLRRCANLNDLWRKQQTLIGLHDRRTHRMPSQLVSPLLDDVYYEFINQRLFIDPPTMSCPPLPSLILAHFSFTSSFKPMTSLLTHEQGIHECREKKPLVYDDIFTFSQSDVKFSNDDTHSHLISDVGTSFDSYLTDVAKTPESKYARRKSLFDTLSPSSVPNLGNVPKSCLYTPPRFPLLHLKPDLDNLPNVSSEVWKNDFDRQHELNSAIKDALSDIVSGMPKSLNFISLDEGIKGFIKPETAYIFANLLNGLIPTTLDDLIDSVQRTAVSDLLAKLFTTSRVSSCSKFKLLIPYILWRISVVKDTKEKIEPEGQNVDLELHKLQLFAEDTFICDSSVLNGLIFQFSFDLFGLQIAKRHSLIDPQNILHIQLGNTCISMQYRKLLSAEVRLENPKIIIVAVNLDGLVKLVIELIKIMRSVNRKLSLAQSLKIKRQRLMIQRLSTLEQRIPDPSFFVKQSYGPNVSALRLEESWKIMARLRYIYNHLLPRQKQLLEVDLEGINLDSSSVNITKGFSESWSQWRGWDMKKLRASFLNGIMTDLPTTTMSKPKSPGLATSLDVRLHSDTVNFIIISGAQKSRLSLSPVFVHLAQFFPATPTASEASMASNIAKLQVEECAVHLDWALIDFVDLVIELSSSNELVELFSSGTKASVPRQTPTHNNRLQASSVWKCQAEVCLEKIIFSASTISLKLLQNVSDLHFDCMLGYATESLQFSQSFRCNLYEFSLKSLSRVVCEGSINSPSLGFGYDMHHGLNDTTGSNIKVNGELNLVKIKVCEDLLGILEIVDTVIRNEVACVFEKFSNMPIRDKPVETKINSRRIPGLPLVNMNLKIAEYNFELNLMRRLRYVMKGGNGKCTVAPPSKPQIGFDMEFDLDQILHSLSLVEIESTRTLSTMHFPPTNGSISLHQQMDVWFLRSVIAIEKLWINGSEFHGLISILRKAEISQTLLILKKNLMSVISRAQEKFNDNRLLSARPKSDQKSSRSISVGYDAELIFDGIYVRAASAKFSANDQMAVLKFGVNEIKFRVRNFDEPDGNLRCYPEIWFDIQSAFADLFLGREEAQRCGNASISLQIHADLMPNESLGYRRGFQVQCDHVQVNLYAETASAAVDIINNLQHHLHDVDFSKEKRYLQGLSVRKDDSGTITLCNKTSSTSLELPKKTGDDDIGMLAAYLSVEVNHVQIAWIGSPICEGKPGALFEDLVFHIRRIDLRSKFDKGAELELHDLSLRLRPRDQPLSGKCGKNSALFPHMLFQVMYEVSNNGLKIGFTAEGKALQLHLDSKFVLPMNRIFRSINLAVKRCKSALSFTDLAGMKRADATESQRSSFLGNRRLTQLSVNADFAGGIVRVSGKPVGKSLEASEEKGCKERNDIVNSGISTRLHTPGLKLYVNFQDNEGEPVLTGKLEVSASKNVIYPSVVQLVLDLSESIQAVFLENDNKSEPIKTNYMSGSGGAKFLDEENLFYTNTTVLVGKKTKVQFGIKICRQEFSLSCHPLARVAAKAGFESINIWTTSGGLRGGSMVSDMDEVLKLTARINKLKGVVQHEYSRDSTFSLEFESVIATLMNSNQVSEAAGIFGAIRIRPILLHVNARHLHDFLLFRDIWLPIGLRKRFWPRESSAPIGKSEHLVGRYQRASCGSGFAWIASLWVDRVDAVVDLGPSIGKLEVNLSDIWGLWKKGMDWEESLRFGCDQVEVMCGGRVGLLVGVNNFRFRTWIGWPKDEKLGKVVRPLVEASMGFDALRGKIELDYQAFGIIEIKGIEFVMFNKREEDMGEGEGLEARINCGNVGLFITSNCAARSVGLIRAFSRVKDENNRAYEQSVQEVEKTVEKRDYAFYGGEDWEENNVQWSNVRKDKIENNEDEVKAPHRLKCTVRAKIGNFSAGVFPGRFGDGQMFLIEAKKGEIVTKVKGCGGEEVESLVNLSLGELHLAVVGIVGIEQHELTMKEIMEGYRGSKGGTILRVPRVEVEMKTRQKRRIRDIEFEFRNRLEGQVDVGWNYTRIGFIRTLWDQHVEELEERLGHGNAGSLKTTKRKNEPSKSEDKKLLHKGKSYRYIPLKPPEIETPQLRDMGEATPPLEWVGVSRERLPHAVHQMIIVPMQGVAREAEHFYDKILGGSS